VSESEVKPVESIITPTRTAYTFTPGPSQQRFLRAIAQGRILGETCPQCRKVYSPPSGACARCGVATEGEVDVADQGTVTTFCIVRVPSENIDLELPYCAAQILLDGSDIPFFGLIQECDWEDVRMGMRVEAVWKPKSEWGPSAENIRYFKPSGEPDVPYERFKEHL
jgi:uncharacterized OB-fold protein